MDYVDNPEGVVCASEEDAISMWPPTEDVAEGYKTPTPCTLDGPSSSSSSDALGRPTAGSAVGASTAAGAFGVVSAAPTTATSTHAHAHTAHTVHVPPSSIGAPPPATCVVTDLHRGSPTWFNPIVEGGLQFPKSDTTSDQHASASTGAAYDTHSFLSSPARHASSAHHTSAMSASMHPYAYGSAYTSVAHMHTHHSHDDPMAALGTGSLQQCPLFEEKDISDRVCEGSLKYESGHAHGGGSVLDSTTFANSDDSGNPAAEILWSMASSAPSTCATSASTVACSSSSSQTKGGVGVTKGSSDCAEGSKTSAKSTLKPHGSPQTPTVNLRALTLASPESSCAASLSSSPSVNKNNTPAGENLDFKEKGSGEPTTLRGMTGANAMDNEVYKSCASYDMSTTNTGNQATMGGGADSHHNPEACSNASHSDDLSASIKASDDHGSTGVMSTSTTSSAFDVDAIRPAGHPLNGYGDPACTVPQAEGVSACGGYRSASADLSASLSTQLDGAISSMWEDVNCGTRDLSASMATSATPLHYGLADRTNYAHYTTPSPGPGAYYASGAAATAASPHLSPYHTNMLSYSTGPSSGPHYMQTGAQRAYPTPYDQSFSMLSGSGSSGYEGGHHYHFDHHEGGGGSGGGYAAAMLDHPATAPSAAYLPVGHLARPQAYAAAAGSGILPPRKFVFCRPLPRRMRQRVDAENAAAAAAAALVRASHSGSSSQGPKSSPTTSKARSRPSKKRQVHRSSSANKENSPAKGSSGSGSGGKGAASCCAEGGSSSNASGGSGSTSASGSGGDKLSPNAAAGSPQHQQQQHKERKKYSRIRPNDVGRTCCYCKIAETPLWHGGLQGRNVNWHKRKSRKRSATAAAAETSSATTAAAMTSTPSATSAPASPTMAELARAAAQSHTLETATGGGEEQSPILKGEAMDESGDMPPNALPPYLGRDITGDGMGGCAQEGDDPSFNTFMCDVFNQSQPSVAEGANYPSSSMSGSGYPNTDSGYPYSSSRGSPTFAESDSTGRPRTVHSRSNSSSSSSGSDSSSSSSDSGTSDSASAASPSKADGSCGDGNESHPPFKRRRLSEDMDTMAAAMRAAATEMKSEPAAAATSSRTV